MAKNPGQTPAWKSALARVCNQPTVERSATLASNFHRGCWHDHRRASTRSAALRRGDGRVHVAERAMAWLGCIGLILIVPGTAINWAFEQPLAPPSVNAHHRTAPWQLSVMRTSVALPPPQAGKVSVMRRRSKPHTFDEWLNAEKTRIEAVLKSAGQGPQRDLLELTLRQIENALHIDGWLSSAVRHP